MKNPHKLILQGGKAMVTIKQVAEEAGVSRSTVSRYISQKGYVSDDARHKIKAAIAKLHYTPNVLAQSLKTKKKSTSRFIITRHFQSFFSEVSKGSRRIFKRKGV